VFENGIGEAGQDVVARARKITENMNSTHWGKPGCPGDIDDYALTEGRISFHIHSRVRGYEGTMEKIPGITCDQIPMAKEAAPKCWKSQLIGGLCGQSRLL
jgi:hypothetical protein